MNRTPPCILTCRNIVHMMNYKSPPSSYLSFHPRWPKWAFPAASVMCGSTWESRSIAVTHGTLTQTPTKMSSSSVASASTVSTCAGLPEKESHSWNLTAWRWSGWRSCRVAATPAITGGSTAPSPLSRNTQNNQKILQISCLCMYNMFVPLRQICVKGVLQSISDKVSFFSYFYCQFTQLL